MKTDEYRKVSYTGAYDAGDYIYASNGLFNGMLKLDKTTGEAIYMKRFEEESTMQQSMHGRVFRYANDIIFTPDWITGIHIYDVIHDEMKFYSLFPKDGGKTRCINSFIMDDKLWLFFAYADQPVIIFDLNTHLQENFYGVQEALPKEIREKTTPVFFSEFSKVENKLYGAIWNSHYIMQCDMRNKKVEIYALADCEIRLSGVAFDGEFFWLTEFGKTHVIKWKPSFQMEIIVLKQNVLETKALVYCNIVCCDGKVILIPNSGEEIFYVDEDSKELKLFCKLPEKLSGFNDIRKTWRRFLFHDIVREDTLRLYPIGVNMMCDINLKNATAKGYEFCFEDDWDDKKYKESIFYTYIAEESLEKYLVETKEIDLGIYLDYVANGKCEEKELRNAETGVGTQIWQYVSGREEEIGDSV